jgi:hypothetical protein
MLAKAPLVGVMGYAQAGKDTFGTALGYDRIAFADQLKALALACHPEIRFWVEEKGWEWAKLNHPGCREFLQDLGVGAREIIGPNVWVDAAFLGWNPTRPTVITDVRFPNEVQAIRDRGGLIVKIVREGHKPPNNHVSETYVDEVDPDYIFTAPYPGIPILQNMAHNFAYLIKEDWNE